MPFATQGCNDPEYRQQMALIRDALDGRVMGATTINAFTVELDSRMPNYELYTRAFRAAGWHCIEVDSSIWEWRGREPWKYPCDIENGMEPRQ